MAVDPFPSALAYAPTAVPGPEVALALEPIAVEFSFADTALLQKEEAKSLADDALEPTAVDYESAVFAF